jgi:hypothetical protein
LSKRHRAARSCSFSIHQSRDAQSRCRPRFPRRVKSGSWTQTYVRGFRRTYIRSLQAGHERGIAGCRSVRRAVPVIQAPTLGLLTSRRATARPNQDLLRVHGFCLVLQQRRQSRWLLMRRCVRRRRPAIIRFDRPTYNVVSGQLSISLSPTQERRPRLALHRPMQSLKVSVSKATCGTASRSDILSRKLADPRASIYDLGGPLTVAAAE